jgi:hypothetical protein
MAVKKNEADEAMVAEFFKDVPSGRKNEKKEEVKQQQVVADEGQRQVLAQVGTEGVYRITYRRRKDGNFLENVNKAWADVIDRGYGDVLKKFDSLGFNLDRVDAKAELVLEAKK